MPLLPGFAARVRMYGMLIGYVACFKVPRFAINTLIPFVPTSTTQYTLAHSALGGLSVLHWFGYCYGRRSCRMLWVGAGSEGYGPTNVAHTDAAGGVSPRVHMLAASRCCGGAPQWREVFGYVAADRLRGIYGRDAECWKHPQPWRGCWCALWIDGVPGRSAGPNVARNLTTARRVDANWSGTGYCLPFHWSRTHGEQPLLNCRLATHNHCIASSNMCCGGVPHRRRRSSARCSRLESVIATAGVRSATAMLHSLEYLHSSGRRSLLTARRRNLTTKN